MNKVILTLTVLVLLLASCGKDKKKVFTYRLIGNIYNSIDTTPFKTTEFKIYYYHPSTAGLPSELKEDYFYTNNKGYFDATTSISGGLVVWPSYSHGASYSGPPEFGEPKRYVTDNEKNIVTFYYDTLYTTPYQ